MTEGIGDACCDTVGGWARRTAGHEERAAESIHPKNEFRDGPSGAEIRAALERIVASDMFRMSPQLAAFLRFVVEATLRGEGGSIKGYTIAVEALGRGEDFDPQTDPIVRVEAGRLRRALEHYYAGPGAKDEVVIDVPRGNYVPTFRRRVDQAAPVPTGIRRGPVADILRTARLLLTAVAGQRNARENGCETLIVGNVAEAVGLIRIDPAINVLFTGIGPPGNWEIGLILVQPDNWRAIRYAAKR